MQPLGARTLQMCSYELGPKTLEMQDFMPFDGISTFLGDF